MGFTEIAKRIKNGDIDAFGILFRNHYPRLLNYCNLFIKEIDIAEDLVQETFISFWEKRSQIDPSRSVNALLYRSLRNRCLNYIRSEKYIQTNNEAYKTEIGQIQHLTHIDYLGEEEIPLEDKLLHEINFAIEKLPERCRIVFKMSRLENLKNKIIAQELGISVKAVEKQLSIGKEKISEYIAKHYPSILFVLLCLRFVFE